MSAESDGFEFRPAALTQQEREYVAFLHGIGFHGQAVGIETGVLGVITIDCRSENRK